jgi:zinc transport system substrate-binding protein
MLPNAARSLLPALALGLALLGIAAGGEAARAQPRVVASIKPLHALVAGVMAGVGQPALLVRGATSPHAYSLRPSDARLLNEAQVVFWVGEALETFLKRPLERLGPEARVVPLLEAEGVALLPTREGGAWEAEAHAEPERREPGGAHDDPPAHHGHGPGPTDEVNAHIWLAPANARAMVQAIVRTLSAADPAQAGRYRANGEAMQRRIDALDAALRARLAPVAARPYVVFHDAYAYLEEAYGLRAVGAITVSPERPPGARRVSELRQRLRELGAVCVFAEPQFQPRLVETLVEGTGARAGTLDPLGADLPAGPEQYFQLMERLADALVACLGPS